MTAGTAPTRVAVAPGAAVVDADARALHTERPAAIADLDLLTGVVCDVPGHSAVATGRPVRAPDATASGTGATSVLVAVWREAQHDLSPVPRDAAVAVSSRVARRLRCAAPPSAAEPLEVVT